MSKLTNALTYSYNRNIGWQDRTLRTIMGLAAIAGLLYFWPDNKLVASLLGVFAIAQAGTVLSARCILCYLGGACTIDQKERTKLRNDGVQFEAQ